MEGAGIVFRRFFYITTTKGMWAFKPNITVNNGITIRHKANNMFTALYC
ncbi:hypothetical protein HDF23_003590 [Mucilaginibacter lappiensis]|uniref:Uncharacterized protein n=1 Tax=Mucilaginibacter lappiensis TaxID=354630 RepID=A0ABR6PM36_9SPHI|nr:hypothetical protein [Mucilaginibacter lappiensis]